MYIRKRLIVGILLFSLIFGAGTAAGLPAEAFQYQEFGEDLQLLSDIINILNYYYIEEIDAEELLKGAIDGMLDVLDDPYTHYLTPSEFEDLQIQTTGSFSGIGITVSPDEEEVVIVSPIKGTPGDRAGLKTGDRIIQIDDQPTGEISFQKAVDMMRGEEGTEVRLLIEREGEEEPLTFEIVRATVEIPNVESELLEEDIGLIRLNTFNEGTGMELAEEIAAIEAEGIRGLILDLRFNPGGLLVEAINVASSFISDGDPVVHIKDRNGIQQSYMAERRITPTELPLVVLVNRGSASGSEIVAGAVQDSERGIIVGEQTFGKGVVQSVIPMYDGGGVSVTTSSYFTPARRSIHEEGIVPDIVFEIDEDEELDPDVDSQLDRAVEVLREMLEKAEK